MMSGFNSFGSGLALIHLHFFFGLFALTGFILLVVWAVRHLKADQLKRWVIGLLILGILGSVLTAPFGSFFFRGMMGRQWFGGGVMGPAMMSGATECFKDEACANRMESFMERMTDRMMQFKDFDEKR